MGDEAQAQAKWLPREEVIYYILNLVDVSGWLETDLKLNIICKLCRSFFKE